MTSSKKPSGLDDQCLENQNNDSCSPVIQQARKKIQIRQKWNKDRRT